MQTLLTPDLYQALLELPSLLTGEILNGQLHAHPRPSGRHILVSTNLSSEIHGSYQRGRGGPGGWWILQTPEIHFVLDQEVAVPDIAAWRKERLPTIPESHKFTVVPDWICEVLSPSTESVDREVKKPLYANYGVRYLWLISPAAQTLEAYKLDQSDWHSQGIFVTEDTVAIEPFESLTIVIEELFT